ncbi:hypothetical protein ASPCAL02550 [Aspergillus calidoustus]|uniref:Uncharacterized protein n=1 Tax=Aspergillus calidoustus TaxID=454130 RepID=A0A0U4ZVI3_ASPCI|nr:hypothetical protein ASPCAL02550 [Aspergillus calidoustus]
MALREQSIPLQVSRSRGSSTVSITQPPPSRSQLPLLCLPPTTFHSLSPKAPRSADCLIADHPNQGPVVDLSRGSSAETPGVWLHLPHSVRFISTDPPLRLPFHIPVDRYSQRPALALTITGHSLISELGGSCSQSVSTAISVYPPDPKVRKLADGHLYLPRFLLRL